MIHHPDVVFFNVELCASGGPSTWRALERWKRHSSFMRVPRTTCPLSECTVTVDRWKRWQQSVTLSLIRYLDVLKWWLAYNFVSYCCNMYFRLLRYVMRLEISQHAITCGRQYENNDQIRDAVHFFTRAGAYGNAIRICKVLIVINKITKRSQ